jgi:pentapeptide MXKDX repeat protein
VVVYAAASGRQLDSKGGKMTKLIAAIMAGMFSVAVAGGAYAGEMKDDKDKKGEMKKDGDMKKDGKKKDEKKDEKK